MIVSVEKFVRGIAQYIHTEVLPKYPNDSFIRFGMGIYVDAVIYKPDGIIGKIQNNPLFQSAMENGNIDLDMLYNLAQNNINESGVVLTLPLGGILRFNRDDIGKIKDCIEGD